jgi:DHA1 family tetracycline resistance protein-like MFS transporter
MSAASTQAAAPPRMALAFIFAVVLLDVIGMSMLIPILIYIVRAYNSDALTITLLSATYAAAQFVATPLLGTLSDRYGRRPVLLLSVLGSAVGYVLFGIGGALWVLFLSRLIDGVSGGNISTASAYIADVTPREERAKGFALLGVAFGLGFIIGPAVSGALSQVSLAAPAYLAAALSLLSAAFGFVALPESLPPERRVRRPLAWAELNPFAPIGALARRPELRGPLAAHCIFNFVVMGYNTLVPVLLVERFGVDAAGVAGLIAVIGLTNLVVQGTLVGRLASRFGERRLAVAGLLFQAVGVASIAVVPAFWMVYVVSVVANGGAAPLRPSLSALLANGVAGEEQGQVSGVAAALASLMSIFGPLCAGVLYDHVAPAAPFTLGAGLLVAASALLGLWLTARRAGMKESVR